MAKLVEDVPKGGTDVVGIGFIHTGP